MVHIFCSRTEEGISILISATLKWKLQDLPLILDAELLPHLLMSKGHLSMLCTM